MQGEIYRICIQGRHHNLPHPHVVVLVFSGAKDCLTVPCFSSGGQELAMYLDALGKRALKFNPVEAIVELDNAVHIRWERGFSGHLGTWVVERARRISLREIRSSQKVGTMSDEGLVQIAKAIEIIGIKDPDLYSAALMKKIRQLIRQRESDMGSE